MNQLYLSFSQMAKILAVSQDFSNKADHMNSLAINEAIDVFEKFQNKRAVGICYHNRGCLKAKLARGNPKTLESAKNDVQRGIDIISELIDERSNRQGQQPGREIE